MKVFVGLSKYGYFVIGQMKTDTVVFKNDGITLNNIVRLYEVQSETGKIAMQFHPDPYFMTDETSTLNGSDFIMYRLCDNQEDKVYKDYQEFLTKLNLQRSGLIAGGINPSQARKIIQEGSY